MHLKGAVRRMVEADVADTPLHDMVVRDQERTILSAQQDLATRINRPQSFVSKYELGERRLDVLEFVMMCHAVSVDPCSIIREVESRLLGQSHPGELPNP